MEEEEKKKQNLKFIFTRIYVNFEGVIFLDSMYNPSCECP
jgi:hypothetical protein